MSEERAAEKDAWRGRLTAALVARGDVSAVVGELLAEAWDAGRRFGQVHWASNYFPEVPHRPDVNPYRTSATPPGASS